MTTRRGLFALMTGAAATPLLSNLLPVATLPPIYSVEDFGTGKICKVTIVTQGVGYTSPPSPHAIWGG